LWPARASSSSDSQSFSVSSPFSPYSAVQSLEATALVKEVYLRLVDQPNQRHFANRRHFFGAGAMDEVAELEFGLSESVPGVFGD